MVMLNGVSVCCWLMELKVKLLSAPGLTVIPVCEPVILPVALSVAVINWEPVVFKVRAFVNVLVPLVNVESAGKTA